MSPTAGRSRSSGWRRVRVDRVPFAEGYLELADDEAWLVSDATAEDAADHGFGAPTNSRVYGPVPVELLVGRAWFRYAPLRRIGLIARR